VPRVSGGVRFCLHEMPGYRCVATDRLMHTTV
jgi:hypothetical protein